MFLSRKKYQKLLQENKDLKLRNEFLEQFIEKNGHVHEFIDVDYHEIESDSDSIFSTKKYRVEKMCTTCGKEESELFVGSLSDRPDLETIETLRYLTD